MLKDTLAQQDAPNPVCHIVTPIGMLGYGLNEAQISTLLQTYTSTGIPTALILDSGSTDGGPSKLANGEMTQPRSSYVRDLTKLLRLVDRFKVPLIFSSAGGDGSDEHVREIVGVIEEIAQMEGNEHYNLKTIAIFSEIKKSLLIDRLNSGAIIGCGTTVPALTERDVEAATKVVSQMGPEPFLDAMLANPDFNVIAGGRAYDPSPYVAYAAYTSRIKPKDTKSPQSQRLWGGFTHMGKIMECGGLCATPKSAGAGATVYSDGTFDITPADPAAKCTPISVSAHTLYEKSRPDILYGPGGWLDLTASNYEQLEDGRTCRVRGGLFTFSRDAGKPYQVKLEAATVIGYRSMYLGSIKDPILTSQIDAFLEGVKQYAKQQCSHIEGTWDLDYHIYGKDQVSSLPDHTGEPSEVFLVGEVLASSQELANSVAHVAKVATIHGPYPGQKATSGNFAHGIGGRSIFDSGPCAQFCIYHLMELKEDEERLAVKDEPKALFSHTVTTIGKSFPKLSTKRDSAMGSAEGWKLSNETSKEVVNGFRKQEGRDQQGLPRTLGDIARVLRSKNSGPYEITFDVMFEAEGVYQLVKSSNILNRAVVAKLVGVKEGDIIWIGFFDQARAFKATVPRMRRGKPVSGGSFMESDMHGAQKYMGLMNMDLPKDFVQAWWKEVYSEEQ